MKQTSQAIALLISTASAANPNVVTSGFQQGLAQWQAQNTLAQQTPVVQAQSRTAGYNWHQQTGWSWAAAVTQKGYLANNTWTTGTLEGVAITVAGSGCMKCIGAGAVWCSRTFSFTNSGTTDKYQYEQTTLNLGITVALSSNDATTYTATTPIDQGTCCDTKAGMATLIGVTGALGSPTQYTFTAANSGLGSQNTAGNTGTYNACVAYAGAVSNASTNVALFGVTTIEAAATAWTSWWCSNGLYKTVTASTLKTINATQTLSQGDNQRTELALVGCPQIASRCGFTTSLTGISALVNTTPIKYTIPKSNSTLTFLDKCTWVATSLLYAPTFTMTNGDATASTDNIGLNSNTSENWNIHYMEYIASAATNSNYALVANKGALISQASSTTGYQQPGEGLALNLVPKFQMNNEQFSTLRTWYSTSIGAANNNFGAATVYGTQAATWFTPTSNVADKSATQQVNFVNMSTTQQYGNVSNIPYSSIAQNSAAAAVLTSGQNYGQNLAVRFDFRTVRYMPASAAQTVWAAGSALNTSYTSQTTSYATAKTTWNAYVAILKKNAKMDAFAAAFSPPKAPTVPPLPNMPWTPAPYSGYLKQSVEQNTIMLQNQSQTADYKEAAQPTNQQFWTSLDAAQTIGGWGSFTASVLRFRNGWGKSFGTIGYGPGTQTMSQVWNSAMMCGSTTSLATQTAATACDQNYVVAANATSKTSSANNTANTAYTFVMVISLWSIGDTALSTLGADGVWNLKQSIGIVFTAAEWNNTLQSLSAISPPTAPTAADSLTGVAGASALAASSAAVLAIAALY